MVNTYICRDGLWVPFACKTKARMLRLSMPYSALPSGWEVTRAWRREEGQSQFRLIALTIFATGSNVDQANIDANRMEGGELQRKECVTWPGTNALSAKIHPVERKVLKINTPILGLLLGMILETELIHITGHLGKETFLIGTVLFVCNPNFYREKGREKGGRTVGQRIHWTWWWTYRSRNKRCHFSNWDGSCAIIEQDVIKSRTQRDHWQRDIHKHTCEKHICGRVQSLNPLTKRIQFFNRHIFIPTQRAKESHNVL